MAKTKKITLDTRYFLALGVGCWSGLWDWSREHEASYAHDKDGRRLYLCTPGTRSVTLTKELLHEWVAARWASWFVECFKRPARVRLCQVISDACSSRTISEKTMHSRIVNAFWKEIQAGNLKKVSAATVPGYHEEK